MMRARRFSRLIALASLASVGIASYALSAPNAAAAKPPADPKPAAAEPAKPPAEPPKPPATEPAKPPADLSDSEVQPNTPQTESGPPPKRTKVTCAEYRRGVEHTGNQVGFDPKLKVGSWGSIPKQLRKLPPGAKLCGSDGRGQVVITSPLFGPAIEKFYAPTFSKLGFGPLTCNVASARTQCTSKRQRDIGIVITDLTRQAYVLAFVKRP